LVAAAVLVEAALEAALLHAASPRGKGVGGTLLQGRCPTFAHAGAPLESRRCPQRATPNTAFANCPDARSRRSRRPGLGGGCTIEPPYGRITAIRGATAAAQRRLASQPVGGGKRLALRAIRMWVGNTRRNATLVANSGGRILPLRRALVPIQEGTVRNWRGRRSKPEPRMGSHTV